MLVFVVLVGFVVLGVRLGGFARMMLRVKMMGVREMRMVAGVFMVAVVMMAGGLAVMLGGLGVMGGGLVVMLCGAGRVHACLLGKRALIARKTP